MKQILEIVSKNTDINICKELYTDWSLHGYYARYANISINPDNNNEKYFLSTKNCNPNNNNTDYFKIELETQAYDLYEKINYTIE